jgi:hypothetical protein
MAQHLDLPQTHRRRRPALGDDEPLSRVAARPLDDETTEIVRVIEFLWPAGDASVQPVLWVTREFLH